MQDRQILDMTFIKKSLDTYFVVSIVLLYECPVLHLLYLVFVMSVVCNVYCLLCLLFVMSTVCYV